MLETQVAFNTLLRQDLERESATKLHHRVLAADISATTEELKNDCLHLL